MKKTKSSIAFKNAIILVITLMPFLIGLGVSASQSNDLNYFGAAINISGSERMRTMLISNYSQRIHYENNLDSIEEYKALLADELEIYVKYMDALLLGDDSLDMELNKYESVTTPFS